MDRANAEGLIKIAGVEGQQLRDLGADRRRGGKKAGRPPPLRREACVEEQAISL